MSEILELPKIEDLRSAISKDLKWEMIKHGQHAGLIKVSWNDGAFEGYNGIIELFRDSLYRLRWMVQIKKVNDSHALCVDSTSFQSVAEACRHFTEFVATYHHDRIKKQNKNAREQTEYKRAFQKGVDQLKILYP